MSTSLIPAGGEGSLPRPGSDYNAGGWQGGGYAGQASGGMKQLITRTVAVFRRYRWLILSIFVVGSAAGVAATRLVQPKYRVNATIWISKGGGPNGPVQSPGIISNDLAWQDLARSFIVLDNVVSRLALYVTPKEARDAAVFRDLHPTDQLKSGLYRLEVDGAGQKYRLVRVAEQRGEEDRLVETGVVGDSIGRVAGFQWQPGAKTFARSHRYEFEVVTPREAAVALQQRLLIALPMNSNVMTLTLEGEQAGTASETMNAVIRQFVKTAEDLKKENLSEVARTVDDQLRVASDNLHAAETALESFKINAITQPNENVAIQPGVSIATNPVMNAYFADRTQLEGIRRDREQLERIINEGSSRGGVLSPEALRGAPALLTVTETGKEIAGLLSQLSLEQAQLRLLRERYTDQHEAVKAKLATIKSIESLLLPRTADKLLQELRANEGEMTRRVDGASVELRKIPQRTIEEQRRTRNVAVAQTIFQDLQTRAVSARLSEQTVMPDVAILDTAVAPRRPSSDTTLQLIIVGMVASLGLGIAVALLLDRLDGRFRYPEQASADLGLDVIGAVPSYVEPRTERLRIERTAQMRESFRSLALSVRSSFPPGQPVQVAISSPGPGDGKSTVSINLATALAEGGYRTLLVDGDIRRGRLHESFPSSRQAPGLVDHLAGEVALADIIHPSEHVNLFLIPCGTRRRQGPELLASQQAAQVLRELRSSFDAVIVDCAPLGAGIDAYALGSATGAMLVVLRVGETDRQLANSKLAALDRMPIRILGAVLNDIGESSEYRYYHYLDGYSLPETTQEAELVGSGNPEAT